MPKVEFEHRMLVKLEETRVISSKRSWVGYNVVLFIVGINNTFVVTKKSIAFLFFLIHLLILC